MRMMSAHKISTKVNGKMSKCGLIGVWNGFFFISPVEDNDDQLCAIFFYLGNFVFQLLFTLKMIL